MKICNIYYIVTSKKWKAGDTFQGNFVFEVQGYKEPRTSETQKTGIPEAWAEITKLYVIKA